MLPTPQYGWNRRGFQMPPGGLVGIGGSSQQGDAKAVSQSLQQMAQAALQTGNPIAAAALEVGSALANIVSLFGPNPNNTITTEWVNQMEADVMKPNLAAWQALPPEAKTPQAQQYALEVFSQGWGQIVQLCSNPQLGSAGSNCLRDRQRGGKWDWWGYYYDPIAHDPQVAANVAAQTAPTSAPSETINTSSPGASGSNSSSTSTGNTSTVSSSSTALYWGLGLLGIGLLFALMGED